MRESAYQHTSHNLRRAVILWAHRGILWLSNHWLAVFNTVFLLYGGVPFLAPVLLAYGYYEAANAIYAFYKISCHQLPSRAYFILGQQVALCEREIAIYATMLVGGIAFNFVRDRLQPPALRWYVFFLVPIALDGGMAMASEWLQVTNMVSLWAIGLIALGITSGILRYFRYLTWHSYVFFAFGPLALLYLQFFGPYESNWYLRHITGFILGVGTVWYGYPKLEHGFRQVRAEITAKLAQISA
jgi:uncharacterized membrane protein